jgi:hypothetical protein
MLLAPLAESAGGLQLCRSTADSTEPIFPSVGEPDYGTLLAMIAAGKENLDQIKRFDMPGFRPLPQYLREMRRYGILTAEHPNDGIPDPYTLDRRYWESMWCQTGAGEGPAE